jgi:threonine dehydrogenase-like Zn-dependent dehydrogenase
LQTAGISLYGNRLTDRRPFPAEPQGYSNPSSAGGEHTAATPVQKRTFAMKAVTWHGKRDVRVDTVPDPKMEDPVRQVDPAAANVKKWVDDILPLLTDDPLGVDSFATHALPLDEAPHAYDIFQKKQDGAVKIILRP